MAALRSLRDDGVHRRDLRIINAVERCGACGANVVGHTSSERSNHRSLRGICHRSVQAFRGSGTLDTRSDARRERRKIHGRDREKAPWGLMQIMPRTWTELRARYGLGADPYDIRATTSWLVPHTSANSMIDTARRVSSPPTMPGLDVTKIIWRQVDRCRMRHKPMSRRSHRRSRGEQIGGNLAVAKSLTSARSRLFVVRTASNSSDERPSSGMRPDRPSSVRAVVDLSALVPQSGNLFVRRASEIRSQ